MARNGESVIKIVTNYTILYTKNKRLTLITEKRNGYIKLNYVHYNYVERVNNVFIIFADAFIVTPKYLRR